LKKVSIVPVYISGSGKESIGSVADSYEFGKGRVTSVCGNGILETGETCDDGNNVNGDGCSNTCQMENDEPVCGNGILETGETCDDGNTVSGDGCSSICQTEITSCDLTSAVWSTTNVVEGTNVNLNVYGTNCNGKTISFVVKEDDLVGSNDVNINPVNVVFSGSATGTWTAEYQTDISGDPEYYFIATVVGETENIESGKSDTELLHVSESVTEDLVLHRPETLSFSGTNYEEIAHEDAFLIDDGTVAFWFNAENVNAVQGLLSKDSTGYDTGGHLSISIESGKIEGRLQGTTGDNYVLTTTTLTSNNWHHIALIFGSDGLKLYLDGDLEDSNSYTGGLGTTSGGSGNFEPIVIGAASWNSDDLSATPVTYHFSGEIKDVRVYNKILTEAEIALLALVENGCGDGTCDPGEDCNTCSSDCGVCPPNGDYPNEPSGFTTIVEDGLTALPGEPTWLLGNSNGFMTIVSDNTAPVSGPNVVEIRYPINFAVGSAPAAFYYNDEFDQDYEEFYSSVHIKLNGSDWESPPSNNKLWYVIWGAPGPTGGKFGFMGLSTPVGVGSIDETLIYKYSVQGVDAANYWQEEGAPGASSYRVGEWLQLEVYMNHSDVDVANGVLKVWGNGELKIHATDLETRKTGFTRGFWDWEFTPVYGGTHPTFEKTRDDHMRLDHVYLSGKGSL
jgi:cysteine-rich repeat protein